jgi:DNA replication protein DnaC
LGKTFLSSCIANELLNRGKTVLYQTAPVMLDTIMDFRFGKETTSKDIYENLLNVDLLIIDDLGTEYMNTMKFSELFNILNTRLLNSNQKITKTIISTNLSLQDLFSCYDERIVSRIVGNYHICYFFGDDIRFKKAL